MMPARYLPVFAAVFCLAFGATAAADPGADPRGVWLTPGGNSHVEIAPCGDKLCGRIVWLKEPNNAKGQPLRDARNEEESLRSRPILGLPVLTGFPQEPTDGVWEDGKIYSPKTGKTFRSEMEMKGRDTLKVSGCKWIRCKSQIWKRVR